MRDDLYKQTPGVSEGFSSRQPIGNTAPRSSFVRGNLETTGSSIASRLSVITLKRRFSTSVSQRPRDKQHEIEISQHLSRPLISGIPRFTVSESFRTTPRADLSPFSFISVRMSALYHGALAFRNYLVGEKTNKKEKRQTEREREEEEPQANASFGNE